MIIDSHAHLNFEDFKNDWPEIIADCQKENVWLINVGSQLATSRKAVEIADKYKKGIYAAVGLHPIHVSGSNFHPEEFDVANYRDLIKNSKKVVAVGETGLDFYHDAENIDNQKKVFIKLLNLAKEFKLPVILHARNSRDNKKDAYEEILEILAIKRYSDKDIRDPASIPINRDYGVVRGVIHCFGGTVKQAKAFLVLGFYIGFTGVITFPKTEALAGIIKVLPLDKILIETDSPYLAPVPFRGQHNRPQYVRFVAEEIAKIKQIDYNEVVRQTGENAINLFNLN